MEAPALRLGASIKHIMSETSRLLLETKPCTAMAIRVSTLARTIKARSELEDVLNLVVDRDVHELNDGNVEFRSDVDFTNVFYGACVCSACSVENNDCSGLKSSHRPQKLTAKQLDAYVRLRISLCVWATQAHRFVATTTKRPSRSVSLNRSTPSTKVRHAKAAKTTSAIKKVEKVCTVHPLTTFLSNTSRTLVQFLTDYLVCLSRVRRRF